MAEGETGEAAASPEPITPQAEEIPGTVEEMRLYDGIEIREMHTKGNLAYDGPAPEEPAGIPLPNVWQEAPLAAPGAAQEGETLPPVYIPPDANPTLVIPSAVDATGTPFLLKDKIAADPAAYDFSDILTGEDRKKLEREIHGEMPLEVILGGYAEITTKFANVFYFKPPQIRELRIVSKMFTRIAQVETKEQAQDLITELVCEMLYVIEGKPKVKEKNTYRPATPEEVESDFDEDSIMAMFSKYAGITITKTEGKSPNE